MILPLLQLYLTKFKDKIQKNLNEIIAVSMPEFKEKKELFPEKTLKDSTFSQNYEKKPSFLCFVMEIMKFDSVFREQNVR